MRVLAWACLSAAALVCLPQAASAGVKVTQVERAYQIRGVTGNALLAAMDKHGPKHGFLTRAIAQTSYSVSWKIEWAETARACRVKSVDGTLAITYTYPRIGDASPVLQRRWKTFLAGVRKHERHHGEIAMQMAKVAEKSVAGVRIANDRGCVRARTEVKRRMAAVYAEYEAKQIKFDAREHSAGGKVEGLIGALVR